MPYVEPSAGKASSAVVPAIFALVLNGIVTVALELTREGRELPFENAEMLVPDVRCSR